MVPDKPETIPPNVYFFGLIDGTLEVGTPNVGTTTGTLNGGATTIGVGFTTGTAGTGITLVTAGVVGGTIGKGLGALGTDVDTK